MSDLSERLRVDAHEAMMGALRGEAGVEEEEMADYSGLSAKFEAYAVEVAELEAKYAKAIKVIACSVSDDMLDVAEDRIAELEAVIGDPLALGGEQRTRLEDEVSKCHHRIAELEANDYSRARLLEGSSSALRSALDEVEENRARIAELELERETLIDSNNDRLRFENRDLRDRIRELEAALRVADDGRRELGSRIKELEAALKDLSEMNCSECGNCLYEEDDCGDCAEMSAVSHAALGTSPKGGRSTLLPQKYTNEALVYFQSRVAELEAALETIRTFPINWKIDSWEEVAAGMANVAVAALGTSPKGQYEINRTAFPMDCPEITEDQIISEAEILLVFAKNGEGEG